MTNMLGLPPRPDLVQAVRDDLRQIAGGTGPLFVVFPYYWRVRTRLPERFGQRCRVVVRGAMNSAKVEFEDGYWVITSRNYLRKMPMSPCKPTVDKPTSPI